MAAKTQLIIPCLAALLLAPAPTPAQESPPPKASEKAASQAGPDTQQENAEAAPGSDRTSLNLLGEVDSEKGESRRNENVRITLIDNNVLRELTTRMGTTATVTTEFQIDQGYFAAEFGQPPKRPSHQPASGTDALRGNLYWTHQNSLFSARSFFQVGSVKPARDNSQGFMIGAPLWATACGQACRGRDSVLNSRGQFSSRSFAAKRRRQALTVPP